MRRSVRRLCSVVSAKPFLITTPIFYVNGLPHIGHAFSACLADTIARWQRLKGRKVHFVTGTDEHGQKIQTAAQSALKPPQELCDAVSKEFRACFDALDVKYTDYIRTTEPRHKVTVDWLWRRLNDRGHIYRGEYEGWYSVSDEAFLTPAQVMDGKHPLTGAPAKVSVESGQPVEWVKESNYMFRLRDQLPAVLRWLEDSPDAIVPAHRHQEVVNWVRTAQADLSVSRSAAKLQWGIPVPGDASQVVYVWLDALANYVTSAGYPKTEGDPASPWPADLQIVGKDILRFHAVYWPAILLAAGLPLPRRILAHSHWTANGRKMSKSLGNVVDPAMLTRESGVDGARYFLLSEGGIANDSDFSRTRRIARHDAELCDVFGNLLMRCTSKAVNPLGRLPDTLPESRWTELDRTLVKQTRALPDAAAAAYDGYDVAGALAAIFGLLREANRYFSAAAPWKLRKEDGPAADHVVRLTLDALRVASVLLQPAIPRAAGVALTTLGVPESMRGFAHVLESPRPQHELNAHIVPLFEKIADKRNAEGQEGTDGKKGAEGKKGSASKKKQSPQPR